MCISFGLKSSHLEKINGTRVVDQSFSPFQSVFLLIRHSSYLMVVPGLQVRKILWSFLLFFMPFQGGTSDRFRNMGLDEPQVIGSATG